MNIPVGIGEKLDIILMSRNLKEKAVLVSQIMEDYGNGSFVIAMPMIRGRLVPLKTNKNIAIVYYRDNGIFEFMAKVIEKDGGRLPSIKVQALTPVKKSQRRNYYRLNTVVEVLVSNYAPQENKNFHRTKCLTLNISAGGMKLASDDEIEKGSIVLCEFRLTNKKHLIAAKVIRCKAVSDKKYAYEIGVQFLELDEKTRGEIAGYIFEQQRKLKRKGLI